MKHTTRIPVHLRLGRPPPRRCFPRQCLSPPPRETGWRWYLQHHHNQQQQQTVSIHNGEDACIRVAATTSIARQDARTPRTPANYSPIGASKVWRRKTWRVGAHPQRNQIKKANKYLLSRGRVQVFTLFLLLRFTFTLSCLSLSIVSYTTFSTHARPPRGRHHRPPGHRQRHRRRLLHLRRSGRARRRPPRRRQRSWWTCRCRRCCTVRSRTR